MRLSAGSVFGSLGLGVFVWVMIGCGQSDPPKPPAGEAIGIVLEPVSGLPRLQVKATFDTGFDPGPHVQPIASILTNTRASCYSKDVATGVVVALRAEVRAKKIHVVAKNAWGECLAKAADGMAIDDPATFNVELMINVASATPK